MSNSIAPGSSADVNIKVTALTTNPNVPVTYKTIILKKNLVNGVNTLTQEMMSSTNTKYIIKYDYILGEDITIPSNCILNFDGGSIANGKILNSNFKIEASKYNIFKNVYFFDALSGFELLKNGVSVRVTQNNTLFNVLTKKKAVVNDIVNVSLLYRIYNSTSTSDSGGTRSVTINDVTYNVGSETSGYSYNTAKIIGINESENEMLTGELMEDTYNEKFYKIDKLIFNSKSIITNKEIYPEWFKISDEIDDTISLSISLILSSFGHNIVSCSPANYTISSTLFMPSDTHLVGIKSDIWNTATSLTVNCNVGILIYDLNAVGIEIEGIIFKHGTNWYQNYIGIDFQCGNRTVDILNCQFWCADIAIRAIAYGIIQFDNISDINLHSCNHILYADACFNYRSYSYFNAVRIQIREATNLTGYGIKLVKCYGITIDTGYSETNGLPTLYADDSIVQISGITWNETSKLVTAINNSFISLLGEIFSQGGIEVDETSVVTKSQETYHDPGKFNYNIDKSNSVKSLLKLDGTSNRYFDQNGDVIIDKISEIKYANGKYWTKGLINVPEIDINNCTILIRYLLLEQEAVHLDLGFFNLTTYISQYYTNPIINGPDSRNLGTLPIGEGCLGLVCVDGKVTKLGATQYFDLSNTSLTKINTGSDNFLISDILIVDKIITNKREQIAYINNLLNDTIIPRISQYKKLGENEFYNPYYNAYYTNYDILKLDISNSCYCNKKGEYIAPINTTVVRMNIKGEYFITKATNNIGNSINFRTPINIKGKSVLIKFYCAGNIDSSNFFNLGFGKFYGGIKNGPYDRTILFDGNGFLHVNSGIHILGIKCDSEGIMTGLNYNTIRKQLNPAQISNIIVYTPEDSTNKIAISDIMIVDKELTIDEFFYYQDILNSSNYIKTVIFSGTFAQKPNATIGQRYFCTSGASIDGGTTEKTNIPIYYTGSGWVDANSTAVVAVN